MYVIKRKPEDFVVEELVDLRFKSNGSYLVIRVMKRGRNTEDVAQLLAERLGIPRRDVGYAGAKDRNAVTTQYFSVKGLKGEDVTAVKVTDVTIEFVGYSDEAIGLGALEGNRFTITIRNLEGDEELSLPESIPNYFDEQRFGSNNAAIGKAIIRKEWGVAIMEIRKSGAPEVRLLDDYLLGHPGDATGGLLRLPRQLLRMYLHSYQSLLWNRALGRYIIQHNPSTKNITYSSGEFIFPENDTVVENAPLPLPGFTITDNNLMAEILAEEGLTSRDFVIRQLPNLSLEGAERDALISIRDFSASDFCDDDEFSRKKKVILTFSLPKGSYATMVVKAMLG